MHGLTTLTMQCDHTHLYIRNRSKYLPEVVLVQTECASNERIRSSAASATSASEQLSCWRRAVETRWCMDTIGKRNAEAEMSDDGWMPYDAEVRNNTTAGAPIKIHHQCNSMMKVVVELFLREEIVLKHVPRRCEDTEIARIGTPRLRKKSNGLGNLLHGVRGGPGRVTPDNRESSTNPCTLRTWASSMRPAGRVAQQHTRGGNCHTAANSMRREEDVPAAATSRKESQRRGRAADSQKSAAGKEQG